MIQVWKYNSNKVFIESCFVEEIEENMTTVPLTIGYIKPTFNEEIKEWYEGSTDEEIQKWKEENQQPSKTNHCKTNEELSKENEQLLKNVEQLKTENSQVWETVEFLLKQVNMIPKEVIENGDTTKTIDSK